jgi:hypothetical protein
MEKGVTSRLVKDEKTEELVCRLNPMHRFKVNKDGFLESVVK